MTSKLIFPIKAVPKERPRMTRSGHAFTPSKTRKYESDLRCRARCQWGKKSLLKGLLRAEISFQFKKAKSSKLPAPFQDLDNLVKSVLDPLQGVIYENDKQIIYLSASKYYGDVDLITLELTCV